MALMRASYNPEVRVYIDVDETLVRFEDGLIEVHKEHVKQLKNHWSRGHHVTVWSAGGGKWSKYVVNALHLNDYVHETIAKPSWIYDDKDPSVWLERIYHRAEGFNNGKSHGAYTETDEPTQGSSSIPSATHRGDNIVHPVSKVPVSGSKGTEEPEQGNCGAW